MILLRNSRVIIQRSTLSWLGIHGGAAVVGRRYRKWLADNPDRAPNASKAVLEMVGHKPSVARAPGDHGEYIEKMDHEFHQHWMALGEWREDPQAQAFVPTADEWAEQVDYVIKTVGADHVAIGLDMVGGRSSVPQNAGGYAEIFAAIRRVTTPENARKISGENWLRVIGQAKA